MHCNAFFSFQLIRNLQVFKITISPANPVIEPVIRRRRTIWKKNTTTFTLCYKPASMFLPHSKLIHKFPFKLFLQDLLKICQRGINKFLCSQTQFLVHCIFSFVGHFVALKEKNLINIFLKKKIRGRFDLSLRHGRPKWFHNVCIPSSAKSQLQNRTLV